MKGFKDDQNKSNQQTSLAKKVTGKVKGTICQCYKKWIYISDIFGKVLINILTHCEQNVGETKVPQIGNNLENW